MPYRLPLYQSFMRIDCPVSAHGTGTALTGTVSLKLRLIVPVAYPLSVTDKSSSKSPLLVCCGVAANERQAAGVPAIVMGAQVSAFATPGELVTTPMTMPSESTAARTRMFHSQRVV